MDLRNMNQETGRRGLHNRCEGGTKLRWQRNLL
jgi:hypothetical protein